MILPHISCAFENIQKACDRKLSEHYPLKVPETILSRYRQELSYLKKSEALDDFEIFRLLSEKAAKCSAFLSLRGTVTGSFLCYLLGNIGFNPLPVHYYCPDCGYYEAVDTRLFGIDLPEKECPHCGKIIMADGYNLPTESTWGNDGKKLISFEYSVSSEFYPVACQILNSIYPDNSIVPWGVFRPNASIQPPEDQKTDVVMSGYLILPAGNSMADYPNRLSYLENGDCCIAGNSWDLKNLCLKPIPMRSLPLIDCLIYLQRVTGIYVNELSDRKLREITWRNIFDTSTLNSAAESLFHEFEPKTYRDMVSLYSSSCSSFSWQQDESLNLHTYSKMISSEAFKKYPCFTREDFFDCLLEDGQERAFAFEVSEKLRKGYANLAIHKVTFWKLPIPEELKDVARNYRFIPSRADCIEHILIYARLAYYAKADHHSFL